MQRNGVAVLNYGAQYANQIVKTVRNLGVWAELLPYNVSLKDIDGSLGIIHSGSKHSVYENNAPLPDGEILELLQPQLGLCYGHQAMQYILGGEVGPADEGEYGVTDFHVLDKSDIFNGLNDMEKVLMSHRDVVKDPAVGFEKIGYTKSSDFAALRSSDSKKFGTQFHMEVYETPNGSKMLDNFLDICGCKRDWSPVDLAEEKMLRLVKEIDNRDVVVMESFGKDSTTTALLVKMAEDRGLLDPNRIFYVHIDHGLGRKKEVESGAEMFRGLGFKRNFFVFDTSKDYFDALNGISNSEEKRKIVGKLFWELVDEYLLDVDVKLDPNHVYVVGSQFTDIVESSGATGTEDKIKTHHNVDDVSRRLRKEGRLIEPLNDFYKDDTKKLASKVGLPEDVTESEPYPGPGWSVRIKCVPEDFLWDQEKLEETNAKANEIANRYGLKAYVRPYKTVGVQGDSRTEVHPVLIEGELNESVFRDLSKKLPDSIKDISRIWYLLDPPEVKTLKLQYGKYVTRERVNKIKECEYAVKDVMKRYKGKVDKITQFPVFLIPDNINKREEIVVLRPFYSLDYMTGKSVWLPEDVRNDIITNLNDLFDTLRIPRSAIALEGEGKPPGTTELE